LPNEVAHPRRTQALDAQQTFEINGLNIFNEDEYKPITGLLSNEQTDFEVAAQRVHRAIILARFHQAIQPAPFPAVGGPCAPVLNIHHCPTVPRKSRRLLVMNRHFVGHSWTPTR